MTLLIYIKNLCVKALNALLGNTWLFIFILAWFLIVTGLLFLYRPQRARNKLVHMSFIPVKWIIFFVCLYLTGGLLMLSEKMGGLASLVLMIVILVSSLRFYFTLKRKLFKKFILWFSGIPIKHLKLFALVQIVIGASMLILKRRIWF